jgi:hypothetical protein
VHAGDDRGKFVSASKFDADTAIARQPPVQVGRGRRPARPAAVSASAEATTRQSFQPSRA